MPGIIIKGDEPFEKAMRRFKKLFEKSGIISDMKKHQHFEKPSERKKRKINAAKRKRIKMEKLWPILWTWQLKYWELSALMIFIYGMSVCFCSSVITNPFSTLGGVMSYNSKLTRRTVVKTNPTRPWNTGIHSTNSKLLVILFFPFCLFLFFWRFLGCCFFVFSRILWFWHTINLQYDKEDPIW